MTYQHQVIMDTISEIDNMENEDIEETSSLQVNAEASVNSLSVKAVTKNHKEKNYNKQISCNICGKLMRNDNLKRHEKTHADILTMDDASIEQELSKRKGAYQSQ